MFLLCYCPLALCTYLGFLPSGRSSVGWVVLFSLPDSFFLQFLSMTNRSMTTSGSSLPRRKRTRLLTIRPRRTPRRLRRPRLARHRLARSLCAGAFSWFRNFTFLQMCGECHVTTICTYTYAQIGENPTCNLPCDPVLFSFFSFLVS